MKDKARKHVRSICDELKEDDAVDLRHWLRAMKAGAEKHRVHITFDALNDPFYFRMVDIIGSYNLTKDGENQSEEFYKAYCEIVGV